MLAASSRQRAPALFARRKRKKTTTAVNKIAVIRSREVTMSIFCPLAAAAVCWVCSLIDLRRGSKASRGQSTRKASDIEFESGRECRSESGFEGREPTRTDAINKKPPPRNSGLAEQIGTTREETGKDTRR